MKPILTIIIATLNCPEKLKECLDSASLLFSHLGEDYFEFLIQDGSVDDRVEKVVNQFQECLHILYVREPDNGIYDAWNHALQRTSGDWVFFVGADDRFIPDFPIVRLLDELKASTKPLVTIPVKYIFGHFSSVSLVDITNFSNSIRYSNPFHHQGAFQQTKLIEEISFDTRFKIAGDFDAMLAITQSDPNNIVCLDMPALIEMHSGGVSSRMNTNFMRLRERAMVRKKNGIKTNYPIVFGAYIAAMIKTSLAKIAGDERLANFVFRLKNHTHS